jgi:hypothetical protein
VSASDFASGIPRRKFKDFLEHDRGNVRDFDGPLAQRMRVVDQAGIVAVVSGGSRILWDRRQTLRKVPLLIEKNGKRMRGEHVGEMVFNLLQ